MIVHANKFSFFSRVQYSDKRLRLEVAEGERINEKSRFRRQNGYWRKHEEKTDKKICDEEHKDTIKPR